MGTRHLYWILTSLHLQCTSKECSIKGLILCWSPKSVITLRSPRVLALRPLKFLSRFFYWQCRISGRCTKLVCLSSAKPACCPASFGSLYSFSLSLYSFSLSLYSFSLSLYSFSCPLYSFSCSLYTIPLPLLFIQLLLFSVQLLPPLCTASPVCFPTIPSLYCTAGSRDCSLNSLTCLLLSVNCSLCTEQP